MGLVINLIIKHVSYSSSFK